MKELKLRNSPLGGRGSFCNNRAQEVGKDDGSVLASAGSDQTSATEGSAQKGAGSDQHGIIAGGSAGVPDKGVQKHVGTAGLSSVVVIPTQWVSAGYAVLVSDPGFMMSDGPALEPASVSIAGADSAVLSLLGVLPHWALGLSVFAESCYHGGGCVVQG